MAGERIPNGKQMVESVPVLVETEGLWLRRHRLVQAGHVLGELAFAFGPQASFSAAAGQRASMRRVSLWRADYRLWIDGVEMGQAGRAAGQRDMTVRFAGRSYLLQPRRRALGEWMLLDAAGATVARLQPGGLARAPVITPEAPLDVHLLAFVYFLVVLRWRAARRL